MKRLPNYSLLWVSFIVFLCTGCNPASQLSVSSPDGNLCLHVETENGKLYYELSRNGKHQETIMHKIFYHVAEEI